MKKDTKISPDQFTTDSDAEEAMTVGFPDDAEIMDDDGYKEPPTETEIDMDLVLDCAGDDVRERILDALSDILDEQYDGCNKGFHYDFGHVKITKIFWDQD